MGVVVAVETSEGYVRAFGTTDTSIYKALVVSGKVGALAAKCRKIVGAVNVKTTLVVTDCLL